MDDIQQKNKVLILGLGGAGGRIVQQIAAMPEAADWSLCAFDTDRRALSQLTALPDECRILCDEQWLLGQGTGGDVMKGQRAMTRESSRLQSFMRDAAHLVVVGGLGGGTATGGAGVISRLARTMSLTAVCLFELPFAFEGHVKNKAAEDGLRELLALSDTVLGIPNDLLFSVLPAETAFADAFRMADVEMARTVLGLVNILLPGNLLSADLGDLIAVLRNRKSYAAIGVGYGNSDSGSEACNQALSGLLDSPFLGGAVKLKEADAVIMNFSGGDKITLSEVKRTMEHAGELVGIAPRLIIGANVQAGLGNQVFLTAIAVKYDEREATVRQLNENSKPARRRSRRAARDFSDAPVQQMLPLTIANCGIFEGRTPTVIDGVNFDIPAFVRRQVTIDTGE